MIAPIPLFPASASPEERVTSVRGLITAVKLDRRPILVGPWRSELGFEALYWMPFLRWLSTQVKDFDQRACVVTRGGLAPLYGTVASRGYDLYALRSVDEVRRENLYDFKQTAMQKQTAITDWDTEVLEDAAKALGIGPVYHTIHPAWMYWALTPFWEEQVGTRYLDGLTVYDALPRLPKPVGLPEVYVAVKFYSRATFPYPATEVGQFIQRICGTLAAHVPLVAIVSGSGYDDHADVPVTGPNVTVITTGTPTENLIQQAAIFAHARAVVGTYGGAIQLALRLGVPTVSFWKTFGGTARAHLGLSQWIGMRQSVPFLTGSMAETGLWQQVVMPPVVQGLSGGMVSGESPDRALLRGGTETPPAIPSEVVA